jgi:archaeosine synthase beta-subunit
LTYPDSAAARDRFVLDLRGPKAALDPLRAYAAAWEEECDEAGAQAPTAVVFLTNRECPFRCAMCDLWVNTLDEPVPRGAIARQIRDALATLPPARHIKLYNAGSFFDPQAIPVEDYDEIAATVAGFDRVIVEAHPAFLRGAHGDACRRFRDLLGGRLEVAVGLETVHQEALAALNKRMTLDDFADAAAFLERQSIALRVFVLLDPPFVPPHEAAEWALSSVRTARSVGASVCAVIPVRDGNGAIDALPVEARPRLGLRDLEWVMQEALGDAEGGPQGPPLRTVGRGFSRAGMRVFADLWDIERLFDCGCSRDRAARLARMNREQAVPPPVACACNGR